jgi:hypothetical protein
MVRQRLVGWEPLCRGFSGFVAGLVRKYVMARQRLVGRKTLQQQKHNRFVALRRHLP